MLTLSPLQATWTNPDRRRRARGAALDPTDPPLSSAPPDAIIASGGPVCPLIDPDGLVIPNAASAAFERHHRP